jgi:DNA-binding CsgD family transcriptional regulator
MNFMNELTQQERIVLALVAKGWRNAKIASELVVSTRTVENHLYHIFDKLGVSSRTEAAFLAVQTGLLSRMELSGIAHDGLDTRSYDKGVKHVGQAERELSKIALGREERL